jgi:hypothetical protein
MAMQMMVLTIAMLICFQVKHFVGDYMLQPGWMRSGKGDMRRAGGYAHAGIHAFGSLPALMIAGLDAPQLAALLAAEFALHYAIDFSKASLSSRSLAGPDTQAYWTLHGADQLMHQMTYAGLILAVQVMQIPA